MKKAILGAVTLAFIATSFSASAADATAGKEKFNTYCAACHGVSGKGDGAASAALNPKPRNFTDQAYMSKKTDTDLTKVIKGGGAAAGLSTSMPPWGSSLSDADIANVVAHIRTLK